MQELVKRDKGERDSRGGKQSKEGKQSRFNAGREKGEELHYIYSHLSPPGDTAGWSCPTAAGQHLGYPILLLTPPSSCPTDQKLLHFLQGYQILPALGSAGPQGGRKQQEHKAGDGRKGIEGQPAAHWAGSAIKTAPD